MKRRTDLKRFGAFFALLLCFGMLYVLSHTATQAAPPDPDSNSKFQLEQVDVDSVTDLSKESAIYIVRLQDPPLASYRGGIRGLAGTSPAATGKRKVDARSSESVAYINYLDQKQAEAIGEVNQALDRSVKVVYQYTAALNGFAAEMTAAEALIVGKLQSVDRIEREQMYELQTDVGPAWLGAPAVWGENQQDLTFEAPLSGDNEVPPVTTSASGMASFSYNPMTHKLHYHIEVSDIMSITAAHIHQAPAGANGGVIHGLYNGTGDFDPDHPISGMVTLSPDEHEALMDGDLYVNVHTTNHPPGELRGQIMQVHRVAFNSHLSGLNEVPPVTDTMASGMGRFSYNAMTHELDYHIEVSDIMSITAAHIHQAPAGANGGVIHGLYNGTGDFDPDNPISGMVTLSPDEHEALMNGDLYINVHTANHPSGELRGQIMQVHTVPFNSDLSGLNEVPPVTDTMASGMGSFSYNPMTHELDYRIEVSDIMSITAAHIHQAPAGANGGVIHTLYNGTGDFDPDHPISGMVTLSPDEHKALMSGDLYINVHTTNHPPGELRGQIMQANFFHAVPFNSHLSGLNEVPPVTDTMASGMGSFSYNATSGELDFHIQVSNIMSITAAHIHSGTVGNNGGVLYTLYDGTGEFDPDHPLHGSVMLSDEHKAQLWNGALYVNIHTTNHPSGELRGQIQMNGTMGEEVLVGVIDTGIDPWNPSFADVGDDGYDHTNPFGDGNYVGVCDPNNTGANGGVAYDATFPCNDKLIGAWGYTASDPNPRDSNGHGSHTAGTAAGNVVMNPTIETPSQSFSAPIISGVAPHANIIMYDGCFDGGGCPGSSLSAARNQALLDGVDVINYSIGSGTPTGNPWNDVEAGEWLALRDAGVFVATSAGNAGPGDATVGSPSDLPWMTTVGASSHNRAFLNTVIVDGGALELHGLGMTGPLTTAAEIVLSSDYVIDPATAEDARLCAPGAFPAGTFTGQIVVCERGQYGRVAKGQSAADGGAGGYILAQPDEFGGGPGAVAADPHVIPGVHIDYYTYQDLLAYMGDNTSVMGTITGATLDINDRHGDVMASFSSRGPNRGLLPDLIVPNVTAPGRSIWAAYHQGEEDGDFTFNVIQGTSMSSPHVAGAGALMVAQHPNWTPAQIESALMSTARDSVLNDDGVNVATPFAQGSGHVDLRRAAHAGLVLDVTTDEFQAANPEEGGDAKTLNIASMGDSQCLGVCSWNRTVKSSLEMTQTWSAMLMVADGVTMTGMVHPMNFTLPAGGTQELTVTVDVRQLPVDEWAFAKVMLTPISPTHPVPAAHLPIAVNPTAAILPPSLEIDTRRNAGSVPIEAIRAMEITDLNVQVIGLTEPDVVEFELLQDPTNGDMYDDLSQVFWMTMTVPVDTYSLIAEILASESPDLDIAVGMDSNDDGKPDASEEVCLSAGASWTEFCEYRSPDAGVWWVVVQNWDESANPPDAGALATTIVPNASNGNMSVDGPDMVPAGEEFDLRVFWNEPDMEAGDRWYGAIRLGSDAMNAGNIGTIPVYLNRHPDDVTKHAPSDAAHDEPMTYSIVVEPNVTQEDLVYMLTDTIPAGMTYVEGSLFATEGTITITDDIVTWTGTQPTPFGVTGHYEMSTSADNPACDTGFGGYVDLEAFGIMPIAAISGDTSAWTAFTGQLPIEFYGIDKTGISFTDDGFAFFDSSPGATPWLNTAIPDRNDPNDLMAFLWNDMQIVYDGTPGSVRGVSLAGNGPNVSIIEYDDIELFGDSTSRYDIELVVYSQIDNDPGAYEMVFAYDNLTGPLPSATIGVENQEGITGTQYLFGDATGMIQDGLMICFDYVGPSFSPITLGFDVMPSDTLEDDVITNTVHHNTDNPGSMEEMASASTFVVVHDVELSDDMEMSGDAGTMVTYTLEITNTGNVTDMFTLTVDSDWTTDLSTDTVGLDAGESMMLMAQVTIPADAMGNESDMAMVNAMSHHDDSVTDTVKLTTSVNAIYGVELAHDMAMTGDPGTMVTYTLEMTNTGNVTDMFTLTVDSDWTTDLSTDTVGLDAGESMMLMAKVTIPADAMGNESDMAMVSAMSHHDDSVSDMVELTTSATAIYGVELAHDMAIIGNPDSTVTYTLQITNTGNITDSFDIVVDSDWSPMSDTLEMAAGESAMVMVSIDIPADAENGDEDMATVTATSDGNQSESASVSLTTTAENIPNNGDGNGDGIPDNQQENVTSLPNAGGGDDGGYATLESPPGTVLENADVMTVPMTISLPSGVTSFPQGIFDFEVSGVSTDTTIMLTITLHADESGVDSYWKRDGNGVWYDFAFSDTTGTGAVVTHEMSKTLITLHLRDGAWGDDDGDENGTIVDPGAPATREPTAISLTSFEEQSATLWQALWIALLLLIGVSSAGYFYARRRKRA